MNNWYSINDTKLIIVLGLSLLWITAGWLLYAWIGVSRGPKGGIDQIGAAIAYVFIWKLFIYIPPIFISVITFALWLYQNHRKAIIWVVAIVIVCIVLTTVYKLYLRKLIYTPQRAAAGIITYEEWKYKEQRNGFSENKTETDNICGYVKDIISETVDEFRSLHNDDDIAMKKAYIDAAMKAHADGLPHVEGWEYIPDIRELIPDREDGDDQFLLNNREFCIVAEHYQRTLNKDHWYDRYHFERCAICEWYSWLPMIAVFYDDGSMDLVIAV